MEHTILLVDDDENLLNSLKRSLHKENYYIRCAVSASEAKKILHSEEIDLIISDQDMPGKKGTEFLSEVNQEFPDIVKFLLTGKATLEVALEAINKGAIRRFFIKPCGMVDLTISIREALQYKDLICQAKRLLQKVQDQVSILKKIETKYPGITEVKRDTQGAVIMDNVPSDFDGFMKKINDTLGESDE